VSVEAALARENPTGVSGGSAGSPCDDASAAGDEVDEVVPAAPDLALNAVPDAAPEPDLAPEEAVPDEPALDDANADPVSAFEGDPGEGSRRLPILLEPPRPEGATLRRIISTGSQQPSKNPNRGCDGDSCLNLSTSDCAVLKSSALKAASVCAMRSVTSCGYSGAWATAGGAGRGVSALRTEDFDAEEPRQRVRRPGRRDHHREPLGIEFFRGRFVVERAARAIAAASANASPPDRLPDDSCGGFQRWDPPLIGGGPFQWRKPYGRGFVGGTPRTTGRRCPGRRKLIRAADLSCLNRQ